MRWDGENRGFCVAIFVTSILVTALVLSVCHFATEEYVVVMQSPTEEQVMEVYDYSGEENRFWVQDVSKVYGDDSLVEVRVLVRRSEGEARIEAVMDSMGISSYVIGEPGRRD